MPNIFHQFLSETPFVVWACIAACGVAVETAFNYRTGQPVKNLLVNVSSGLIVCFTVFVLTPFKFMAAYWFARQMGQGLIPLHILTEDAVLPQIGCVLLYIFVKDFFFYFYHRLQHKVGFLWDIHSVHHSDRDFNITTYLRQHWLDGTLQAFLVVIPMTLLFQLPPIKMFDISLVISIWVFFTHMNLHLELGRFSWVVTGPQLHRLHHSNKREHIDTNFAQYFPIWDVIFRTYVAPKPGEYPPTGLGSGERIETMRALTLSPFDKWQKRSRAWRKRRKAV